MAISPAFGQVATIPISSLPNASFSNGLNFYVRDSNDCLTVVSPSPINPTLCHSNGSTWAPANVITNPGGTTTQLPLTPGLLFGTGTAINVATSANVVSLFGSGTCSGYLKSDGTCSTPTSASASSLLSVPLNTATLVDGQAYVYSATNHDLEPVAINYWRKIPVSYTQLTGFNALSGTVTLMARAARQKICGVSIVSVIPFAGTSITATSVSIGDSNGTTSLYTPQPFSVRDGGQSDFNVMGSAVGASNIQATFTAIGANLSALTAGTTDVILCLANLPN